MFKRIYLVLVSGALLFAAPNTTHNSSNIKKIIKSKDKVVVIIRENGKDKRVVLDSKTLAKMTADSKTKKTTKSKKITNIKKSKVTKNSKKVNKSKKVAKAKTSKKKVTKIVNKRRKSEYQVAQGDTLFSIARKFKVNIEDITKLNRLGSSTLIHPGDIIKIPSKGYVEAAKEAVAKNNKTVYRVKRGDTVYSIARLYNMKPETIRKLNNLKRNPKLKPGMELTVLGKAKQLEKRKRATKYVVRRGDTIWKIARMHGLTISQLKLLNPSLRRGLRRGSVLKVSKIEAIKLTKLLKRRKRKLSGVLARYQRTYSTSGSSGSGNRVVRYAKRWLGSRYVWGASRPGAFDCSGFTSYVMRHAKGRSIPRVSRRQAYYGRYVSRRNLRAGDLIFFDTSHRRRGYVNHVGIYIGHNKFIHASSAKHRVVITSLNKPFYRSRFMWGRRVN